MLALPAGVVGTVGAQAAGNDAPTPVLDAPDTIERGQLYHLDGSDSTGDIEEYRWDYNPNAPTEYQRGTEQDAIYAEDRTDEDQDQFTVRLGVKDSEGNVEWTNETINVTAAEDPNASMASSDDFTVEREQWETEGGAWFNSTSTDNRGIRSCEWTFEYGPTVERTSGDGLGWGSGSTECNKNFSYAVPGTYNVTLNVTDWAGNSDNKTRQVEVVPKNDVTDDPQPNAELSGPDSVERGATYWVNASNSTSEDDVRYYIGETNPDVWWRDERNLGDDTYYGEYYDGQFDTIDVAVGVLTVNGQTDWAWQTIDVLEPEKPDAVVEAPDAVATGDWATFDASNSTDNDRIRSYEWTVTDTETGETVHTDGGEAGNYQFTEPGTYDVTVRVGDWVNHTRDGAYHYGVATKTVTVTEDGETPNEEPTVSASADPRTVTASDDVTLSADAADADGTVESIDWDLGDGDTAAGQSVTHTYDTAGTYTATVTVTDDEGATASESVDITVEAESDDSDSDGGASGDGGGSSEADDSDSPDDSDPVDGDDDDQSAPSGGSIAGATDSGDATEDDGSDTTVDVSQTNESTTVVTVSDAPDDENVEIDLGANDSGAAVGYENLSLRSAENDAFSLRLTAHESPSGSSSGATVDGFDAISTLTVDGADVENLSDATIEFRVSKDRLAAADADAEDVALRRTVDGESRAVDTEQIDETDDDYVYRANAGTVTSYTVGVERPVLTVTELSVADGEPTAGDTVEVTATVTNEGQAAGSMDVALTMDGEVHDEQSVEVAAGESSTVTFSTSVGDAATHTVSAGEASTTLSVTTVETATEVTTTPDDEATPGTSFGGISGVGMVVLLAIAGAALVLYRR